MSLGNYAKNLIIYHKLFKLNFYCKFMQDGELRNCRICHNNNLREFIDFGQMPVANAFLRKEDLEKQEYRYRMAVGFCEDCKMTQLIETVPYDKYIIPDEDSKTHYAFFSSTSAFMERHFAQMARGIEEKFLSDNPRVVEIGSNDGIMLKSFSDRANVLGIEPSYNVAQVAIERGIETLTEFFSEGLAKIIKSERGASRAVLSTNVFLNIMDIHDFMKGVNHLLDEKGVFVTEDPYIGDILENGSYDQIYDEHIWYFSLHSLSNLFEMHDFEIFDAEKQDVHGGSMRVYSSRKGVYEKTGRFLEQLKQESERGITAIYPYLDFAKRVEENRYELANLLKDLKSQGKRIVGYAAASKGTIVQNYCGIGPDILDYISDSTPIKQGLYTPGKHIPIVSPEIFHNDKGVDYALLGAWNHAREIMGKEQDFLKRGGKFITHLPSPRIL